MWAQLMAKTWNRRPSMFRTQQGRVAVWPSAGVVSGLRYCPSRVSPFGNCSRFPTGTQWFHPRLVWNRGREDITDNRCGEDQPNHAIEGNSHHHEEFPPGIFTRLLHRVFEVEQILQNAVQNSPLAPRAAAVSSSAAVAEKSGREISRGGIPARRQCPSRLYRSWLFPAHPRASPACFLRAFRPR